MNCKKCGSLIDKEAKFCPYCGEKLVEDNSSSYQDPFSQYRNTNTHQDQYQYQQTFSNTNTNSNGNRILYADDFKKQEEPVSKDNKALIGLILSILSIPFTFIHMGLGIAAVIIGFILVIVGFKHTSKGMKIASLIISIFSLVIVAISSIFMFVAQFELDFDNGYRTTIGDYFKDAFFSGYNSSQLEGYWVSSDNELFYLDDDEYYLYMDVEDLNHNYFKGSYNLDYGYELGDDTLFSDDDYYYYTMNTFGTTTDTEEEYTDAIMELLNSEIIIGIDKHDFDNIVLYFVEQNTELELTRY